jgi:hypothetical protein
MTREKDTRKLNLRDYLRYNPRLNDPTDAISWLLSVYYINPIPANIAVFKHMLWSIKRCIWDKTIDRPLFYCFHSSQQAVGKTELIKRLTTGFEWVYSANGSLRSLLHENDTIAMLRDAVLIDFQELSLGNLRDRTTGAIDESVIAKLKAVITSPTIGGRIMYTSDNGTEAKRAVFSSSTNKHIWEVISDATGMRRYWEFELHVPSIAERRATGKSEFYLDANVFFDSIAEIYQAIDESNDRGFVYPGCPEWESITNTQASYARSNPLLTYITQSGWVFKKSCTEISTKVTVRKIVDGFNAYLDKQRMSPWKGNTVIYNIRDHFEVIPEHVVEGLKSEDIYHIEGYTK